MYSSGTTSKPKCTVHGHGGTILQHLKEHQLHTDIKPGDRLYTTCGWMMWNWLVSGLASRASILLYDGSPQRSQAGPGQLAGQGFAGLRRAGIKRALGAFLCIGGSAKLAVERHHTRAERYGGQVSQVEVKVAGRTLQFELAVDGKNILDGALKNGADLPFSCKSGVCATYKARLLEGEVEMDLNHSLSQKEVEEGMVLTCQSHPVSKSVKVDFDQT